MTVRIIDFRTIKTICEYYDLEVIPNRDDFITIGDLDYLVKLRYFIPEQNRVDLGVILP